MNVYSTTRLTQRDKILFIKNLALLMNAHIDLQTSLTMLCKQMVGKSFVRFLAKICAGIERGQRLSAALRESGQKFGPIVLQVVAVGELSGSLGQSLDYLARELTKRQQLSKKIISAFMYPSVIVAAAIGIIVLLLTYVFPKILPIFASFHLALPLTTRIVIQLSLVLKRYLWLAGIAGFVVTIGLVWALTFPQVRLIKDRLVLNVPFIKNFFLCFYLIQFCRTFGVLLKQDANIAEIIAVVAGSGQNSHLNQILSQHILPAINQGQVLSAQLGNFPRLFPTTLVQICGVGEQTGNLAGCFMYIAEIIEQELDDVTKNLSALVEPVLMVIMGGIVGFIAISIISPIYQITQSLHT